MKNSARILLVFLSGFLVNVTVFAQDDEARQQSGLPNYIGSRPGTSSLPGTDAALSGSLLVQGLDEKGHLPTFTVLVLANGAIVSRQQVQNRGVFTFNNVPRTNVSLVVEADGLEITNFQLGTMNPPPLGNRHDIFLTSMQIGHAVKRRNEVLSVRNAYSRSNDNQKLLERGLAAAKEKKIDAATKLLKQLLDVDAKDFVAWTEIGNLYFTAEKYGEAETAYNKSLELKADFTPSMLNLGKLSLHQKKSDAAIEILSKAVLLTPDSADINHYLGEAYLQAKKGSKAVVYLTKAIELAPVEKAEIHLRLAALYNGANLKDRAAAEYKLFLGKVPKYPERAALEKYIKDNSAK